MRRAPRPFALQDLGYVRALAEAIISHRAASVDLERAY